ncbi:MAG: transcription elongation factor GreB [Alphaproteobacteria bacterium]|nr:transcription elongation factor GreB [Alphaproteobacteria bacterium]
MSDENYMTPSGFEALKDELHQLMYVERPKVVEVVSWAAGNGDRSENGDYIYGKKRLREIDRRVHYLTKRIETAIIVDSTKQKNLKQIFFGATVTYVREDESEHVVTLVSVDEADMKKKKISWQSPMAKALLKAKIGDQREVHTPSGIETIEILDIHYGD